MGKHRLLKGAKGVSFPAAGSLKEAAVAVLKKGKGEKVRSQEDGSKKGKMTMKLEKKHGQHLLKNPGIVKKIIEAADIKKSDVVLEIGPGTGNLTMKLCGLARKVRAIDIDVRMTAEVKKRVLSAGYTNLEVVHCDALKADFGEFSVCTANLPYQISSPFVFKMITVPHTYRAAVLMFQKEFGERLVAKPHDKFYCRLSVNTQLFFKVTRVCHVSAGSFNPPPKVDSIVIKLVPVKQKYQNLNYLQWDAMLRIAFSRKRKTLAAAFTSGKSVRKTHSFIEGINGKRVELRTFKDHIRQLLESIPYKADHSEDVVTFAQKRAVELSIPDLLVLLHTFSKAGIIFPVQTSNKNVSSINLDATTEADQVVPLSCFADDDDDDDDEVDEVDEVIMN
ncbi:putative dimethyladenosine transferase [Gregarina niphandrodes]|uniref:rRNA adenine N(6)-methyltransferase n=1 Tax=Gregarina niphandrodes TaxID=110365 RepID=A0A023B8J8_GRENI|nr:putative dimethyladenosine transferase [Gregarina niphandrodes]EZG69274.1 putative dimethyladenosine transferase [Gregarina niphandrodes]|eukprot:XP_011134452.1 putative dimethyladenosine transferase [Gregarina niphandrodes]